MKSNQRSRLLLPALMIGGLVLRELRKPSEERTWHGKIGGIVPYELRPPTFHRVRERIWNPNDPSVIQPTVFGAGWTINVGRLARLARWA